jgi:PKHD-type hydroxylase
MSIYNFSPKAIHAQNNPFVTWKDGFTEEEINKIVEICEKLPSQKGVVGEKNDVIEPIRTSSIAWLSITQESEWIYDRLAYIARCLNAQFYDFDLSGFVEDMQFTTYYGDQSGHYTWHNDFSDSSIAPRKLSLVLQLSDPSEYEGGELQTFTGLDPISVDKTKGLIAAFPSWTLHRVTPVTKGVRKTLVIWVAGKQFK